MLLPQQPAALQAVFENNPPCILFYFIFFKKRWKGDYLSFIFQKLENAELSFLWRLIPASWSACGVLQALAAEWWAAWVMPVYIPTHGHCASHSWEPCCLYKAGSTDCSPQPNVISKCCASFLLRFTLLCARWSFTFADCPRSLCPAPSQTLLTWAAASCAARRLQFCEKLLIKSPGSVFSGDAQHRHPGQDQKPCASSQLPFMSLTHLLSCCLFPPLFFPMFLSSLGYPYSPLVPWKSDSTKINAINGYIKLA